MEIYSALTKGGRSWTPQFIEAIDHRACIGCGRCFKVCGFGVLTLVGLDEDGNQIAVDEDDDEIERKVMTIAAGDNCIGCGACARVCGKNAQHHAPAAVAAFN
jgi:Nif-specific ferredoxin III